MNHSSQILLETPRLILRTPVKSDSDQLKSFEERNIFHFSPWKSTIPSPKIECEAQLEKWKQELEEGRSTRFILFLRENPDGEIIGFCNFTQIFRGPFQACYLGYHIDAAHEKKGFMSEAVRRTIRYMFEEQNLHRIMANYMPSNQRSAQLLQKLGFKIEGVAEKYLLVNGLWEDHVLTSLTNPDWKPF